MDASSRIVFGYHGTTPAHAERLIRGELAPIDWLPSHNVYDWLGHGIYFWEFAPERARHWMKGGGVVGAIIRLGNCLDLTDISHAEVLAQTYSEFVVRQRRWHKAMPTNVGKLRTLDCAVINYAADQFGEKTGTVIQTVRGAFLEGDPIFPGSGILKESHIQLAVRDPSCIIGVFRPT